MIVRQAVFDRDGGQCRMPACLHPEADGGRPWRPQEPSLAPTGVIV
jgi:hypothetical protein